MSAPVHPHSVSDLALAPVLINIERNLARLRDSEDLELALALELNDDDGWCHSARDRADRVQRCAVRGVDLHGWTVSPTQDLQGLAVSHSDYTVSVMLGRKLAYYVQYGPSRRRPDAMTLTRM